MSEKELSGRVALVTGAGRNIGRAMAKALAAGGAAVIVNVRSNKAEAEQVVREIARDGGKAIAAVADVADEKARIESIPRLRELLRVYPHPLVYEMLIQSYMDADRFDEAKGVAFAARERRQECARSPYPEIRAETDRLREWKQEEIEELRAESAVRVR